MLQALLDRQQEIKDRIANITAELETLTALELHYTAVIAAERKRAGSITYHLDPAGHVSLANDSLWRLLSVYIQEKAKDFTIDDVVSFFSNTRVQSQSLRHTISAYLSRMHKERKIDRVANGTYIRIDRD